MLAKVQDSSSSSWEWLPVTALDVDLSSLPLAADALSNMRCEVLDVKPTVGDVSMPMQAAVQVSLAVPCVHSCCLCECAALVQDLRSCAFLRQPEEYFKFAEPRRHFGGWPTNGAARQGHQEVTEQQVYAH